MPATAVAEMNYHNYPIPIPTALNADARRRFKNDPLFNVPAKYTDNYEYILNLSPAVVNQRTQIYREFKAAYGRRRRENRLPRGRLRPRAHDGEGAGSPRATRRG